MHPKRLITFSIVLLLSLLLTSSVMASQKSEEEIIYFAPPSAVTDLYIYVNYETDTVSGETEANDTVDITLKDDVDVLKDTAQITAAGDGTFTVDCSDWDGGVCPDIVPGDEVSGTTVAGHSGLVEIGEIHIFDDFRDSADNDYVDGSIQADWLSGIIDVHCRVSDEGSSQLVTTTTDMDGNETFSCVLSGWDLIYGDVVEVSYFDGNHSVSNTYAWPWMRVNYADDWVGGNYEPGHTFWITVTESDGATVKGQAVILTEQGGGWGEGDGFSTEWWHWISAPPDIQPGDYVYFRSDDGFYNFDLEDPDTGPMTGTYIQVGTISGVLDSATDSVAGPLDVSWFSGELVDVECHPWGAWSDGFGDAPIKFSSADGDGDPPFSCSWNPSTEWDIVPGQVVAVMYVQPNLDRVINVYHEPAPHLYIEKRALGNPGEDGNMAFRIMFQNDGDDAADATITDTMVGLSYLSDSSGYSHTGSGSGPIIWDVGTIQPGEDHEFTLFTEVTTSESSTVSNTVEIETSNPYDRGDPAEKYSEWQGTVLANDTQTHIEKYSWTPNPAAGQNFIWTIGACNFGSTSSPEVTLTDTPPDDTTLQDWWSQDAGWVQDTLSTESIILSLPSLPSYRCSDVFFRFQVDPGTPIGHQITNSASLESADRPGEPSEITTSVEVGYPQSNLSIEKSWSRGTLYPGGTIHYFVHYANDGNVPADQITITDTLPTDTSLVSIEQFDHFGTSLGFISPSSSTSTDFTVGIISLENGFSGALDVALHIDSDATPDTVLTNTIQISCLDDEITCEDNTSSSSAEYVRSPGSNLRVRKRHEWNEDNSRLFYEVIFENVGNTVLDEISLTDTYPAFTTFTGDWSYDYSEEISFIDHNAGANTLDWEISRMEPRAIGIIRFWVNLDDPTDLVSWFTNVVEIEIPSGDVHPADNYYEDVAFNGGEINAVHLIVATDASQIWGIAVPDSTVSVSTAHSTYYAAAEADCGGCWSIENAGPVMPGDTLTVEIVSGLHPVTIVVPIPFTAQGDSINAEVFGKIDSLDEEWVEAHLAGGPSKSGYTDASGNYSLIFPTYPNQSEGFVKYSTEIDYAKVHYYIAFQDYYRMYFPIIGK